MIRVQKDTAKVSRKMHAHKDICKQWVHWWERQGSCIRCLPEHAACVNAGALRVFLLPADSVCVFAYFSSSREDKENSLTCRQIWYEKHFTPLFMEIYSNRQCKPHCCQEMLSQAFWPNKFHPGPMWGVLLLLLLLLKLITHTNKIKT